MKGISTGGGGGVVNMILRIAPVVCSLFAFAFLAVALSSGAKENYMEGLSIVNVCIPSYL